MLSFTWDVLLAILLPPLAVFLHCSCSSHFLLNFALTCFGWLPGILHALWILATPKLWAKDRYGVDMPSANHAGPIGSASATKERSTSATAYVAHGTAQVNQDVPATV